MTQDIDILRAKFAEGLQAITNDMIRSLRVEPEEDNAGLRFHFGDNIGRISYEETVLYQKWTPFDLAVRVTGYGNVSKSSEPHPARREQAVLLKALYGDDLFEAMQECGAEMHSEVMKLHPHLEDKGCFALTPAMYQIRSEQLWRRASELRTPKKKSKPKVKTKKKENR